MIAGQAGKGNDPLHFIVFDFCDLEWIMLHGEQDHRPQFLRKLFSMVTGKKE